MPAWCAGAPLRYVSELADTQTVHWGHNGDDQMALCVAVSVRLLRRIPKVYPTRFHLSTALGAGAIG